MIWNAQILFVSPWSRATWPRARTLEFFARLCAKDRSGVANRGPRRTAPFRMNRGGVRFVFLNPANVLHQEKTLLPVVVVTLCQGFLNAAEIIIIMIPKTVKLCEVNIGDLQIPLNHNHVFVVFLG